MIAKPKRIRALKNPMAEYFNRRIRLLWRINGSGQQTNAAITELTETFGSYRRIENE